MGDMNEVKMEGKIRKDPSGTKGYLKRYTGNGESSQINGPAVSTGGKGGGNTADNTAG